MARKAREETAAGIWHVFARGNNKEVIFRDREDHEAYLEILSRVVRWRRWRCLSYCLMPNHLHLVIETTEPNLGSGMRELQGTYARRFNKRHGRTGHVFGERYGSVWITDDPQFWTVARYVAMNPVRAKLCRRPEEWRWSSHAGVVRGGVPAFLDVERLLELFGSAGGDPRKRYADFVAEGLQLNEPGPARVKPAEAEAEAAAAEDVRPAKARAP